MIFFLISSIISKFASSSKKQKKARSLAVFLVDFNYFSKFSLGYSILLVQARIQLKLPPSDSKKKLDKIQKQLVLHTKFNVHLAKF